MLEMLLNSNPNLYNQCIEILKGFVKESEVKYNAMRGSTGYRPFRIDDFYMCPPKSWQGVYRANTESMVANLEGKSTVPTQNTWAYFGWFTDTDFGINSGFKVRHEGVTKSIVSSTFVYNCENPVHMFIDMPNIRAFFENSRIEFLVSNDNSHDIIANVIPILYRITSKAALNMDRTPSFNKVSNKVQMPINKKTGVDLNMVLAEISRLQEFVNPKPMEYVKVKDENNAERDEIRSKLDPNYKSWIETLKDVEVCGYCGSTIERVYSSQYCHYCGVKIAKKGKIK